MKLTFLGTGTSQGVPVIACTCTVCRSLDYRNHRLRSSVMIEDEYTRVVIDTGPDFRQQMLTNRVSKLDAVVFTHEHKDHTAGMDDIRSFNFKQNTDMPVYARPTVQAQLKMEYAYIFKENKYPGIPRVALHDIQHKPFQIENITLEPVEVIHHLLPVYGYRCNNLAYITDIKTIEEKEKKKLYNLDVLILGVLQKTEHKSHLTLDEALILIEELQPKKNYLTHISHHMGLHGEIEKELPSHIRIAYDGQIIYF